MHVCTSVNYKYLNSSINIIQFWFHRILGFLVHYPEMKIVISYLWCFLLSPLFIHSTFFRSESSSNNNKITLIKNSIRVKKLYDLSNSQQFQKETKIIAFSKNSTPSVDVHPQRRTLLSHHRLPPPPFRTSPRKITSTAAPSSPLTIFAIIQTRAHAGNKNGNPPGPEQ